MGVALPQYSACPRRRFGATKYYALQFNVARNYVASFTDRGTRHRLGTFVCPIRAARAVDLRMQEVLGDRVRHLNFPVPPPPVDGARHVPLAGGKWALVDDGADFEHAMCFTWAVGSHGYAARSGGELLHKDLVPAPAGFYVDHINRNKLDNRRCNLRVVHPSQSSGNTRKKTKRNRYKGVAMSRGVRWTAQITVNRKMHYLGSFATEEAAARAYDAAAREAFGEYAALNFPGACHG